MKDKISMNRFDDLLSTPPEILKTKTFIYSVLPETEFSRSLNLSKGEIELLEMKLFFITEELVKANPASTTI